MMHLFCLLEAKHHSALMSIYSSVQKSFYLLKQAKLCLFSPTNYHLFLWFNGLYTPKIKNKKKIMNAVIAVIAEVPFPDLLSQHTEAWRHFPFH